MRNLLILLPSLTKGGTERITAGLSILLKNQFNVYICLYDKSKGIDFQTAGTIIDLRLPATSHPLRKIYYQFKRIQQVRKIKKEKKIDITLSFLENANIVNLLSKVSDKTIINIRGFRNLGNHMRGIKSALFKLLTRQLYNRSDGVVTNSKLMKHILVKDFKVKPEMVTVIYNFFNKNNILTQAKEKLEMQYESVFNDNVLVNVGHLTRPKAQWHLIRIFKEVKSVVQRSKLVILGDGEYKSYLINLAKELDLNVCDVSNDQNNLSDSDVFFFKWQRNPFKFLSRSTVFALPSLWEGFPNALVEAMICGLPVIAADCSSGPREILAPDTDINHQTKIPEKAKYGILMPVLDGKFYTKEDPLSVEEKMWVDQLIFMLKDGELRRHYKELGSRRASDFTKEKIGKQWNAITEMEFIQSITNTQQKFKHT